MTEFTMVRELINPVSPPRGKSYTIPSAATTNHTTHATCGTCNGSGGTVKSITVPGTAISFSLTDTLLITAFIIALVDLALSLKR